MVEYHSKYSDIPDNHVLRYRILVAYINSGCWGHKIALFKFIPGCVTIVVSPREMRGSTPADIGTRDRTFLEHKRKMAVSS